jgi:hypothetical protein
LGIEQLRLVDQSRSRLEAAQRLFHSLGAPAAPTVEVQDAARWRPTGAAAVALAFALNEILVAGAPPAARPALGARLLRGWLDALPPGGRLYVVEPGTRDASRTLQGIRDRLAREVRVVAPCTHTAPCPLLGEDSGWCHLTWPANLGPNARRVADLAQRRFQETHFSWLILEKAPPEEQPGLGRVLSVRPIDKHKVRAEVCREGQILPLTALRREPWAPEIEALPPGTVVSVDAARLLQKGDGFRLSADALGRIRDL